MDETWHTSSIFKVDEDKKKFYTLLTHFGAKNRPFLPPKTPFFADCQ